MRLEVVTPERIAFSEEIRQVTVPAADGQLTILPKHTALFALLVEGELKIVTAKEEFFLALGGGFIEVTGDKVVILVTRAVHQTELDEKEIIAAKNRAEQILAQKPSAEEYAAARRLLRSRLVDLKVLRHRSASAVKSPSKR